MPTIKSRTIGGKTYSLKQYETSKDGKQYEYYVTEDGRRIDDPVYTREAGMRQFRETVNAIQRAEGKDRNESRGPSIPGFGTSDGSGMFGDEDNGPTFPGF